MPLETMGRSLYLRQTSADGKTHVTEHWVWDAERFLAARKRESEKLNADALRDNAKATQLARVEQITDDQYLKERK